MGACSSACESDSVTKGVSAEVDVTAVSQEETMPAGGSSKIKIYAMPFQHNYWAIEKLCQMEGVKYEMVFTNLMEGAHKTPEMLAKFPMHALPAMEDPGNGLQIHETNAILRYIAMKAGSKLYPADLKLAAICDCMLDHKLCSFAKDMAVELIYPVVGFAPATTAEKEKAAIDKMKAEQWPAMRKFIKENGGIFVCGKDISIADISLWGHVKIVSLMWPACPMFTELEGFKEWFDAVDAAVPPLTDEQTDFWKSKPHA
eukprot:TRINITY_DN202_c0_g1_i1.p1 TRINITY_DN202_c0_g1~~TRINITY_DN202_c0_g1_i1.p1  ORF type:complete len:258 (+),score=78.38 TRINITY_DN202_c0_g1_i1:72-845(+)